MIRRITHLISMFVVDWHILHSYFKHIIVYNISIIWTLAFKVKTCNNKRKEERQWSIEWGSKREDMTRNSWDLLHKFGGRETKVAKINESFMLKEKRGLNMSNTYEASIYNHFTFIKNTRQCNHSLFMFSWVYFKRKNPCPTCRLLSHLEHSTSTFFVFNV